VKVRDRTLRRSEYKGREFDAFDADCPCRPCANAHDCGYYGYDRAGKRAWITRMECATRWNGGCPPREDPRCQPQHVYSGPRAKVCARCGTPRPK